MFSLSELIAHCVWANTTWLRFIERRAPDDEWLVRRLSHIVLGERAWLQRIHGEPPGREIWQLLPLSEIDAELSRHVGVFASLMTRDLDRMVSFERFTGEQGQCPVADILLHLTLHGAHHRGQMATHASATGLAPMNTDFVQYRITQRETSR